VFLQYSRSFCGRTFRRRSAFLAYGALFSVVLLSGCVTGGYTSPTGANPNPDNGFVEKHSAAKELAVAQEWVRAGDYSMVIPRLQRVIQRYPDTQPGKDAHYVLGQAYYHIGGLSDSLNYFNKYLELDPAGRYGDLAREYVAGLADEVDRMTVTKGELNARIEVVEAQANQDPEAFATQLELADLYWRDEQYVRSGDIYIALMKTYPQLETDATIRRRLEKGPSGDFIILTPNEVSVRYAESEPLIFVNTNDFRSGRRTGWTSSTLQDTNYNVTGEVKNRSQNTLFNVEVEITIYGFASRIYDTKTIRIGQLEPGQKRPFVAKFSNFDTIENVDRYECTGYFSR